jgi:hypothetical protein
MFGLTVTKTGLEKTGFKRIAGKDWKYTTDIIPA